MFLFEEKNEQDALGGMEKYMEDIAFMGHEYKKKLKLNHFRPKKEVSKVNKSPRI